MFGDKGSGWRYVCVADELASVHDAREQSKPVPATGAAIIGRGPGASKPFQHAAFGHRYCSRRQLSVELLSRAPEDLSAEAVLRLTHLGRNPTFIGPTAMRLGALDITAAAAALPDAHGPLTVRPSLPASVHFPTGLGIPAIHFFFVPGPAAVASAQQSGATDDAEAVNLLKEIKDEADDDDDDDETPPRTSFRRLPSVLDEAMYEYARAKQQSTAAELAMARYHEVELESAAAPSQPRGAFSSSSPPPGLDRSLCPVPGVQGTEKKVMEKDRKRLTGPATTGQGPCPSKTEASAAVPQHAKPTATPAAPVVWEWKCRPDGADSDPRSWRPYSASDSALLEREYRRDGGVASTCRLSGEHSVCFADRRLGMVQVRRDDPSRWRQVRRRGGDRVHRPHAKRVRCVPQAEDSSSGSEYGSGDDYDREDSFINDDDDDEDDESDDSSNITFDSESSSSDVRRKAKKQRRKKR
jgi:hypothetical protein